MRLLVTLQDYDPDLEPLEMEVESFDDFDKIARRVATTVKRFLRTAQVRSMSSRARFDVTARWEEGNHAAPAKHKKRRKAKEGAADGG